MCDSRLVRFTAVMDMAQLIVIVYLTKYSMSAIRSLCVMLALGQMWQPGVLLA